MKRLIFLLVPIVLMSLKAPEWKIKTETSEVSFKIKSFGSWVKGTLSGIEGSIFFDPNDLANSSISGSVDVSSINTGNNARDNHLRASDYFDAATYPKMTLKSVSINYSGSSYKVDADLTIKNTTKRITIELSFLADRYTDKGVFQTNFSINRKDFGVGGGGPLGNTVKVFLFIPVYK